MDFFNKHLTKIVGLVVVLVLSIIFIGCAVTRIHSWSPRYAVEKLVGLGICRPAIEYLDVHKEYYQNGERHRDDWLAIELSTGYKEYYF